MRDLNRMTLGQRIALTFVIVLIILFAIAVAGWISGGWDETPAQAITDVDIYGDVPLDATLLRLDRRALDEAYHAQLLKLWGVWLVDGAKDPSRFKAGMANARRAYGLALHEIAKREQAVLQHERERRGEP
jgi:exopolysaccharide biosynthesis protein